MENAQASRVSIQFAARACRALRTVLRRGGIRRQVDVDPAADEQLKCHRDSTSIPVSRTKPAAAAMNNGRARLDAWRTAACC